MGAKHDCLILVERRRSLLADGKRNICPGRRKTLCFDKKDENGRGSGGPWNSDRILAPTDPSSRIASSRLGMTAKEGQYMVLFTFGLTDDFIPS